MSMEMIGDRGDWNKIEQNSALIEKLNRDAEKEPKNLHPPQASPTKQPTSPVTVSSAQEYWRIPVNYRNGIYTVDLAKSLLDNGNARTQDDWAEYTETAKAKGDFYVGDMPLYFSVMQAFAKADGKEAKQAREFLKTQMRARWLMTLTRTQYNPKGTPDRVIHNFGTKDKYHIDTEFIGSDGWIKYAADSGVLEALLGNDSVANINNVFQKINGTDAYIWRLNSKPEQADDRVAGFYAGSVRAVLGCDGGPSGQVASLGVRLVVRPKGAVAKK